MDGVPSDLPGSPFCSPAWRWARAAWLHSSAKRAQRTEDGWVARAFAFLVALAARERIPRPRRLPRVDPAIAAAHAIYTADDRRRWVVEALLLAREPIESVAARTTLPVETIAAYAALFFDVAGRLEADDWLMTRVIGIQWLVGLSGASPGAFWRYLALTGGVRGLEFAIAITTGGPFPTWLRVHFRDDPQVEADYRLRGRLLFALMTAGTDQEVEAIVRLDEQRRHVDRPRSAGKREPKKKLDLMAAFIGPRKGRRRRVVDELLGSSATPKVAQAPSAIAHIDLASDYSRLIREPLESGGRS